MDLLLSATLLGWGPDALVPRAIANVGSDGFAELPMVVEHLTDPRRM